MRRVYIQIIDPINGTYISARHEYLNAHMQVVESTLRQYGIRSSDCTLKTVSNIGKEVPGMPKYSLYQGLVNDTSKLVNITVVG